MFDTITFLKESTWNIIKYPDPVLLRVCDEITDLNNWVIISDIMFKVMKENRGCGLAAPQVGLPYRLFVLNITKPVVYVNPQIIESSAAVTTMEEGCLSLPGQLFKVTRPRKVKVKWTSLDGKDNIATYEGWTCRAWIHEFDHLLGILINKARSFDLAS